MSFFSNNDSDAVRQIALPVAIERVFARFPNRFEGYIGLQSFVHLVACGSPHLSLTYCFRFPTSAALIKKTVASFATPSYSRLLWSINLYPCNTLLKSVSCSLKYTEMTSKVKAALDRTEVSRMRTCNRPGVELSVQVSGLHDRIAVRRDAADFGIRVDKLRRWNTVDPKDDDID